MHVTYLYHHILLPCKLHVGRAAAEEVIREAGGTQSINRQHPARIHTSVDLQKALSKLGLPCGKDYMKSLMKQYDQNHNGRVEFEEFQQYVETRQKDMEKAFDKLDADTEGRHLGGIDTKTLVSVPLYLDSLKFLSCQ